MKRTGLHLADSSASTLARTSKSHHRPAADTEEGRSRTATTMRIIVLSAALLLAFGAGFAVARFAAATGIQGTDSSASSLKTPPIEPLVPGPTDASATSPTRSSIPDGPSGAPPTYAALRAAVLLASTQFPGMRIDPFSSEQLNPQFTKLYELTPPEVAHLNVVFRRAKEQVDALEAANAKIEPQPDGTLRVTIEPFPKEGGAFHDFVRSELFATLGPERSELYRRLSDSDESNSMEFGGFGLNRMVFEIRPTGPDGKGAATWNGSIDPKTRLQTFTWQTDLRALKHLRPALYERIVGAGAAR
jgi:hypothetical protein